MTTTEGLLWNLTLKSKKTGFRFLRQKPIGEYIVDFYCSQLLLVVEVDGESHMYTEARDVRRSRYLESLGIRIVRYTNAQIYVELDYVLSHLMRTLAERVEELKKV
jgi:very-short-patch-repair endonuclease